MPARAPIHDEGQQRARGVGDEVERLELGADDHPQRGVLDVQAIDHAGQLRQLDRAREGKHPRQHALGGPGYTAITQQYTSGTTSTSPRYGRTNASCTQSAIATSTASRTIATGA